MREAPAGSRGVVVGAADAGSRLDRAASPLLPGCGLRGRRRIIENGGILLNGCAVRAPGRAVREGDRLERAPEPPREDAAADGRPRLLGRDGDLLLLFKPAGLHTASLAGGGDSLEDALPSLAPRPCILLQRLDRDTSGIVCAAATEGAAERFREAERLGLTDKRYLALLRGVLEHPAQVRRAIGMDGGRRVRVRDVDDPDPARWTDIRPILRLEAGDARLSGLPEPPAEGLTLAVCRIRRGARHQIRVHAAWLGLPLWGDGLYGPEEAAEAAPGRLLLHHAAIRPTRDGGFHVCPPPWPDGLAALWRDPGVRRALEEE